MTVATMPAVRDATLADVDALVAMGLRFLDGTAYGRYLTRHPAQMARTAADLIRSDSGAVFVHDGPDGLTGMLGIFLFSHPLSGDVVASELFWWVEPDARGTGLRLLRRAETWARAHHATSLQLVAPTADVERLYTRLGYAKVETAYQRSL